MIAQGPVASQIAIKQLGTNGGGFFNANSAHPFENPNAITNLIEMWAILAISAALTYTFGRMVGNTRQGWAIFAVMGVLFLAGVTIGILGRGARQPGPRRTRRRSFRRQHGRQGSSLRHRQLDDLGDGNNGRIQRLRQLDARQLHAAGRDGPAGQHHAGRSHLWRRRLRPLRHTAVRHPGGLHRRAHGRPNARIPRQEDRGEGSQDGDAGDPHPAAFDPRLHRDRGRRPARPRQPRQRRTTRLQRSALRLHFGDGEQRQRVCRAQRQYAVLQHDARVQRCSSAAS